MTVVMLSFTTLGRLNLCRSNTGSTSIKPMIRLCRKSSKLESLKHEQMKIIIALVWNLKLLL